jgi:hypothetical protein
MSSKVQLIGGAFQDVEGNPLANGYLLMQLSQDASVASPASQIAAGYVVKIQLDANGNVVTSPAQSVWPNDVLSPANTFYSVSAYTAVGELVWGPNSQQVLSSPSPYPLGNWRTNISNVAAPITQTVFDIALFYPGTYANGQVLLNLALDRAVTFATNLAPSTAVCLDNPTSNITLVLNKNGVQFATLSITTGGVGSYFSSGASFNPGDILQVVAPVTADATLAGVGMILSGIVNA